MGFLIALPVVLLLFQIPPRVALPILAIAAIAGTIYGCYWTMRIIHIDRASLTTTGSPGRRRV